MHDRAEIQELKAEVKVFARSFAMPGFEMKN